MPKTTKKKRLKTLAYGGTALVFAGLMFFTFLSLPSGGLASLFETGDSAVFPYSLSGDTTLNIMPAGENVQIFAADGVLRLDKNARELYSQKLDYTNPIFASQGKHSLVADRADGRYLLHNARKMVFEGKLSNPITLIALGDTHAAFASQAVTGENHLDVLNKKGENIFSWQIKEERLAALTISQNGHFAAAALMRIQEGETLWRVLIFNLRNGTIADVDFKQESVLRLQFTAMNRLFALNETALYCLETDGEFINNQADDRALFRGNIERFAFSQDGRAALIYRASDNILRLVHFNPAGVLAWEKEVSAPTLLALDSRTTVYLDGETLAAYENNSGTQTAAFELDDRHPRSLAVTRKAVYILTNFSVDSFTF